MTLLSHFATSISENAASQGVLSSVHTELLAIAMQKWMENFAKEWVAISVNGPLLTKQKRRSYIQYGDKSILYKNSRETDNISEHYADILVESDTNQNSSFVQLHNFPRTKLYN